MKSKVLLSILVIFAVTVNIYAKDINRSQAEKVAVNFLYQKSNQYGDVVNYHDLNITDSYKVDNAYYVVNFEEGWVIVSAENAMTPVIGYNYEGRFPEKENYSYNFDSWMKTYADQVDFVRANNIATTNEIASEWELFLANDPTLMNTRADRDMDPLLTCLWNQDNPYNYMCPEDEAGPGGHVYVGCVATAMSMIMHYWRYPLVGSGSHSYYLYPYGTQSVNYAEQTYDYNAMTDEINNKYIWEIAKIGYHAAVSVDMGFGSDASGSYSNRVPNALRTYFGMQSTTQYLEKNNYTNSQWEDFLQNSLDEKKPIYYSGQSSSGGHAFVCDGYQGSNYYHFNFGWSGSGNGYYTLQDVNGFNSYQGIVRNIYPADVNYPYVASGQTELNTLVGSLTDGSGPAEDYPSGMNAEWLISPQSEQDSVSYIVLTFIELNTDPNDILRVYDGSSESSDLIGEYSGNEIPTEISSTGNTLFITFSSTSTGEGFKIEYEAMQPSFCTNQTIEEPYGTITDGSGSFNYSNSTMCNFTLIHPEAVKYYLNFTEFSTEENKDYVEIYDLVAGALVSAFSGNTIPSPMEIETKKIMVRWTTNSLIVDAGWSLEYEVEGVGMEETSFDDLNIYPNPTNGILNINFSKEKSADVNIKISNISGQVILSDVIKPQTNSYSASYDISNYAKGVYLLSITSDNEKIDRKIVLK